MFGKKKNRRLFGGEVEQKCEYCTNFEPDPSDQTCRFGLKGPPCGHFCYDPLLRTPRPDPVLKKHDPEEFKL